MTCRIIAALVLTCLCATAVGQPRAVVVSTQPAATRPVTKVLTATVKEMSGTAQRLTPVRPPAKPKWVPLKTGDRLGASSFIRTGFRTRVVLAFADNSVVVIRGATKLGIGQFRKVGRVTKTRVGIKYGSIRAQIHKAKGPNDFRVSSPVAVFAVIGSEAKIGYTGDLGLGLANVGGTWNTRSGARHRNTAGQERVNQTFVRNIYLVKATHQTYLGPQGLSRNERGSQFLLGSGRGIIGFGGAGQGARQLIRQSLPCKSSYNGRHQIDISEEGMYKAR